MNLYVSITLLTVAIFFCSSATLGQAMSDNRKEIKADRTIQSKLDKLMAGIPRHDTREQADEKIKAAMQDLRTAYSDTDLLVQIVLHQSTVKDEHVMIMDDLLLSKIAEKLGCYKIIETIGPLLNIKNKKIRRKMFEIMDGCCEGLPTIDFSRIFGMMRAKGGVMPGALVEYMYARSPGEAMLGYMRYYNIGRSNPERHNILLAEREISNTIWKQKFGLLEPHQVEPKAIEELDQLSRSRYWWVRLYVAEIMRQHRGFRRPEIIERLKKDDHPLVREAMSFADEDAKK